MFALVSLESPLKTIVRNPNSPLGKNYSVT